MGQASDKVRLDKWLWAARFFKTRALATSAVTGGKVHVNGERAKPARSLNIGDELRVRKGPHEWVVVVQGLTERRGPARDAEALYEETPDSRAARERYAEQRRLMTAHNPHPSQRPDKHQRRRIRQFTGKG